MPRGAHLSGTPHLTQGMGMKMGRQGLNREPVKSQLGGWVVHGFTSRALQLPAVKSEPGDWEGPRSGHQLLGEARHWPEDTANGWRGATGTRQGTQETS